MGVYTNFRPVDIIGPELYQVDTVRQFPLGTRIKAVDSTYGAGEFIYLAGAVGTLEGTWVRYNADAGSTNLLAANQIGPVGIALAPNNLTTTFGWYQIFGKAIGRTLTAAEDADVYACGTIGSTDDAVVAGDRVKLAKYASASGTPAANYAEFEIHYPFMDDGLAA